MIQCGSFLARLQADAGATLNIDEPDMLEHLRSCDRCLGAAVQRDPDVLFRSLGGDEMVPPGGVDAFVGEVMQQVRVRGAESRVQAHPAKFGWARRLAVAATLVAGFTGAMLYRELESPVAVRPMAVRREIAPVPATQLATRPIIETYESESATIVEVPDEGAADDVKIVMIFDENLPVDL